MQPTRSTMMIHKLARHALLGETYQVVLDNPDDNPTTYEEAFMMKSMGSNSIWSLVQAPREVVFRVLYVDDILLIGNNVKVLLT